jgi:hypothetical protein
MQNLTFNASSSNQPEASFDEDYMRNIENTNAMSRNSQMIIAENQRFRPNNTTKAYSSKQKEWKTWCLETKSFADGVLVSDEKLSWFLNDYVIPRGRKNKKNGDERKYELGKESILSYVKAIVSLYNE